MSSEDNKEVCSKCQGHCACGSKCQCGSQDMGGEMGMWMHMPKEVKIAKLEKKEQVMKAELEFIGKMKEMVKNKSEDKK